MNKQRSSPTHLENAVLNQFSHDDLRISDGSAWRSYQQMSYDGTVSAALSFLKALVNRPFEIASKGREGREKQVIDALNKSLRNMDTYSMYELVSNFLDCIQYGCSLSEVVLRVDKGLTVFGNVSPIDLTTIKRVEFDKGKLKKAMLSPASNDGKIQQTASDGREVSIDGKHLCLVRLQPSQSDQMGVSLLKGAYLPYKRKMVLEELLLVGAASSLSGVRKLTVPQDVLNDFHTDPASDNAIFLENMLNDLEMLGRGQKSYIVLPSDVVQGSSGQYQAYSLEGVEGNESNFPINNTIQRYDREILLSLQSSILALGDTGGGSFALSDSKTTLVTMFVQAIQKAIGSAFRNSALRLAWEANGLSGDLPEIVFEDIEPLDLKSWSEAMYRFTNAELIQPDDKLEAYIREKAGAPEMDKSSQRYDGSDAMNRARHDSLRSVKDFD